MELKRKNKRRGIALAAMGIMCAAAVFCGFFAPNNIQNAGAYATAPAIQIDEITLSDYATRTDGLVFDGEKLATLFGKIVQGAQGGSHPRATLNQAMSAVQATDSVVVGSTDDVSKRTNTQPDSLNFNTIQTNLGAPLTLTFGGYNWTVVYATTNTLAGANTAAGDLIVTLWMNDNLPTLSQWGETAENVTNVAYPSSMYSSSYIRVKTLNAGGDNGGFAYGMSGDTAYAGTTSSLTSVSLNDRKDNEFANFTLSNDVIGKAGGGTTNPSLVNFLTTPGSLPYQQAENWVWSYYYDGEYMCPNEAWGNGTDGVTGPDMSIGGWRDTTGDLLNKDGYYDWAEDYLWLPSLTETGYYINYKDCGVSLWGIPYNDSILGSNLPSGATCSCIVQPLIGVPMKYLPERLLGAIFFGLPPRRQELFVLRCTSILPLRRGAQRKN